MRNSETAIQRAELSPKEQRQVVRGLQWMIFLGGEFVSDGFLNSEKEKKNELVGRAVKLVPGVWLDNLIDMLRIREIDLKEKQDRRMGTMYDEVITRLADVTIDRKKDATL